MSYRKIIEKESLQRKVFNDLGKGVLDNAWNGYNCSLFAYGQTGSGKSYSMVGDKNNAGDSCDKKIAMTLLYFRKQNDKEIFNSTGKIVESLLLRREN